MRTTANKIIHFKYYNTWGIFFFRFFFYSSSSSPASYHYHHPPHHPSPPHPPPLLLEWRFDQLLGHGLPVANVSRQLSGHA